MDIDGPCMHDSRWIQIDPVGREGVSSVHCLETAFSTRETTARASHRCRPDHQHLRGLTSQVESDGRGYGAEEVRQSPAQAPTAELLYPSRTDELEVTISMQRHLHTGL